MGREKIMKVDAKTSPKLNSNQTNPKGMEVFLNPSPNISTQNKEEVKVNQQIEKTKPQQQREKTKFEEIDEMIRKIAKEVEKTAKEVEFSRFNEIIYSKKLQFKLLMITTKIYTIVKDPQSGRVTIVAIAPPRWGGTSLRFLISQCVENWCLIVEKASSKGKILTYKPVDNNKPVDNSNDDDIFD